MYPLNFDRYKTNLIVFFYKYFCKIYQILTSFYEEIFLRKRNANLNFKKKGIFKLNIKNISCLEDILYKRKIKINTYLSVRKPSSKEIDKLIKQIFTEDIRKQITNLTGFCFSVDFFIVYDRKYIPLKEREVDTLKQAYSYRWHFDKPNSSNMLKIFLPINITNNHGPLEVIDRKRSGEIKNIREISSFNKNTYFEGEKNTIYGLYPTLCFHRDGIPNPNLISTQIMFQLNPNKKWVINKRIYSHKSSIKNKLGIWTTEPKFPLFSYFGDERIAFN